MTIDHEDRFYKITGRDLGDRLLSDEGISAQDFDLLVGSTIDRMNTVGSLRGEGFLITGGHGKMYHVSGWEKPIVEEFDWTPKRLEVREWIDRFAPLELAHCLEINDRLKKRETSRIHESSFGYLWAYEAVANLTPGRAKAFLMREPLRGLAVLQQRFANAPRLRVIDIDLPVDTYRKLIPYLSILSTKPVEIRSLTPSKLELLKLAFPGAEIGKAHQSIYNTRAISSNPESYFSKKSWKSTQKNLREVSFQLVPMDSEARRADAKFIIDTWKQRRGPDQLRLAIGRDYALIDQQVPWCFYIMGYRGSQPVSLRILSLIPGEHRGAADLVEKSFNYSDLPGGHSGMSDTSLIETCRLLYEQGIEYINGGESASVSTGLVDYKTKFEESRVWSYTITPKIPQEVE